MFLMWASHLGAVCLAQYYCTLKEFIIFKFVGYVEIKYKFRYKKVQLCNFKYKNT